ncbi:PKD domain-containing protein [Candidatus Poribacteria bacterium]
MIQIVNILTASVGAALSIMPLEERVVVGQAIEFRGRATSGMDSSLQWNFGDGDSGEGAAVSHVYEEPGIYHVGLCAKDDSSERTSSAILRVHTPQTVHLPQILLDTDARNEVDDQHYISYALFSELDVLGINSVHHGGDQEAINYGEIQWIVHLARRIGLPESRQPFTFHGADQRLEVPESGNWADTQPVVTEASEAILAAARGASPDNPVWVLPVGPCTNVASAVLQASQEEWDIRDRLRVIWLGGGPESASKNTFNGGNDPWSVYVLGESGIEFWIILENPTGASICMDKRTEAHLYPDNALGNYLKMITPARRKALFDISTVSMVISEHLNLGWLKEVEPVKVLGPDQDYRWKRVEEPASVHVVRDIDEDAMKNDFFNTLNSRPTRLIPREE